eukprot:gene7948-5687_t
MAGLAASYWHGQEYFRLEPRGAPRNAYLPKVPPKAALRGRGRDIT